MMNQNGIPTSVGETEADYAFAKKAREALESSSDLIFVGMAGHILLNYSVMVKRLQIDAELMNFVESLLKRPVCRWTISMRSRECWPHRRTKNAPWPTAPQSSMSGRSAVPIEGMCPPRMCRLTCRVSQRARLPREGAVVWRAGVCRKVFSGNRKERAAGHSGHRELRRYRGNHRGAG